MNNNAFSSGIEPGGLTDKNQIKILICYMIKCVDLGLTGKQIADILSADGLVNYFETLQAVNELNNLGHIYEKDELYSLSESGERIVSELDTALPISVRDKAVHSAMQAARIYQNCKDNSAVICESENGFDIICEVKDRGHLMMRSVIAVPDKLQAEMIKERFIKNSAFIYSSTLLLYTASKDEIIDGISGAVKDMI